LRLRSASSGPGAIEASTYLDRFLFIERTGMRFPRAQTQFRQRIENLAALDFQLARQIVDSNLAHPPLFKFCYPNPASCSWLPHGIGCWFHFHYYPFGLSNWRRILSPS